MTVKLISFGFKYGQPHDAALIVDCRSMKNPHNVPELKRLTGLDGKVQRYVKTDFSFDRLQDFALAGAVEGGSVAFGCFGGRHRSVAMAEMLAVKLRRLGHVVEIQHRELDVRSYA